MDSRHLRRQRNSWKLDPSFLSNGSQSGRLDVRPRTRYGREESPVVPESVFHGNLTEYLANLPPTDPPVAPADIPSAKPRPR